LETVAIMQKLGSKDFYELEGGISNWNSVGLEVFFAE
jgi:hypothetical protein